MITSLIVVYWFNVTLTKSATQIISSAKNIIQVDTMDRMIICRKILHPLHLNPSGLLLFCQTHY